LDRLIEKDDFVEFYSLDREFLYTFYHRVLVVSAPVKVVIVAERGGLDPLLIERFRRIFGWKGEIYLRRAFKVEDVKPTIEAMEEVEGNLVVVNPYHHRRKYAEIVSALRKSEGRKFLFSFMDREKEGSIFGTHSAHAIIKLEPGTRGFRAVLKKSVTYSEIDIPFGFWEIYGKSEGEGLIKWMI
jgi:hypothetical protein